MSLFFYLFTFAINLWHREFVTADVTAVFVNNRHDIQWLGKILIKTQIHSHCSYTRTGIKIGALKMLFVCIFSISTEYLQTIWIFSFPRLCSNMPKVRWLMLCGFCSKFRTLFSSEKFWKSVKIWQSYREFKSGNVFEIQCTLGLRSNYYTVSKVRQFSEIFLILNLYYKFYADFYIFIESCVWFEVQYSTDDVEGYVLHLPGFI